MEIEIIIIIIYFVITLLMTNVTVQVMFSCLLFILPTHI